MSKFLGNSFFICNDLLPVTYFSDNLHQIITMNTQTKSNLILSKIQFDDSIYYHLLVNIFKMIHSLKFFNWFRYYNKTFETNPFIKCTIELLLFLKHQHFYSTSTLVFIVKYRTRVAFFVRN